MASNFDGGVILGHQLQKLARCKLLGILYRSVFSTPAGSCLCNMTIIISCILRAYYPVSSFEVLIQALRELGQ